MEFQCVACQSVIQSDSSISWKPYFLWIQMRVHKLFLSRLVLDRVSFAVIPKHHGTERIYFSLQLSSYHSSLLREIREATQGKDLEAGIQVEATEEHCSLACPIWLSLLSATIQDHLPRGCTAHSGLGFPIAIIDQENNPIDVSIGQSYRGMFKWRFPLPRNVYICVIRQIIKFFYPHNRMLCQSLFFLSWLWETFYKHALENEKLKR